MKILKRGTLTIKLFLNPERDAIFHITKIQIFRLTLVPIKEILKLLRLV
jgi:hypothetical protein